jgi:parallel beta-helix repeat protein
MRTQYTEYSRQQLTVPLLTVLIGLLVLGVIASTPAAAAPVTVTDCTTIDTRGEYVLGADIDGSANATCILITSSDVILDGDGHTITGSGAFDSVGVHVDGSSGTRLSNVTVTNLTVTDWETGLYYDTSDDGIVRNVTATANSDYGLNVESATNVTVTELTTADHADWGEAGIRIYDGSSHTITDSSFTNEYTGVDIIAAQGITVRDSTFEETSPSVAIDESGGVVVDNNTIVDGGLGSISGTSGPANQVTNNSIYESSQHATGADCYGMTIDGASDDRIANNSWTQCNSGVHIDDSDRIEFRNNTIDGTDGGNSDYGLWVSGGTDNRIVDNHIVDNGKHPQRAGILLGTHQAYLSGNTLAGNGFNLSTSQSILG